MEKTKSMNRLVLIMVIWAIGIPFLIGGLLAKLPMELLAVVSEILFAVPILGYILVKRIKVNEWIPFRVLPVSILLMSALLGILLLPLTTFINLISMLFATNYVSESTAQMVDNPFLVNLLVVAVIPAVVEELIYRGMVYHAYREKGVIMGMIASGIVFGIMHRNLNQFFYAMVLGFIFCILVEITGSIFASMTTHFVINGWNVLLLAVQKPLMEAAGTTAATVQSELTANTMLIAIAVYGFLALLFTALAVGVMIWMTKKCGREPHMRWCFKRHELPEGVSRTFLTPSFIIMAVIAFVYMILIELM